MAECVFFGKQKLCYTEVEDFTDFQGIGSDPMYKRYDSVFSVVKSVIPPHLQHFLATPEYMSNEDQICWHVDKWAEVPLRLKDLDGGEYDKYKAIYENTVEEYKSALKKLCGTELQIMQGAIKYIDEERVYCGDEKVYLVAWGMTPDEHRHKVIGAVIHEVDYVKKFRVSFDAGDHGSVAKLDRFITRVEGTELVETDFPCVNANEGWKFVGWIPSPIGQVVNSDITFVAQYEEVVILPPPPIVEDPQPAPEPEYECRFDAGEHGTLDGVSSFTKTYGSSIVENELPIVTPKEGYKFVGWDKPLGRITENTVFVAQYERIPWYKRLWAWIMGTGCLKWLLWFLLILLLLFLLSWLLKGCNGCTRASTRDRSTGAGIVVTPGGDTIDYYGPAKPITGDDGSLPDDVFVGDDNGVLPGGGINPGTGSGVGIVAPIHGDDGATPPIVTNPNPEMPGAPDVISNRLNIFFEDANADLKGFSRDLCAAFPEAEIIAGDPNIPMLQIRIPESRRDEIRESLNKKLSNYNFFVVDESIFEISGDKSVDSSSPGWHLSAIHLKEAWSVTQGGSSVVVAVVDDGFDTEHEMIKGRIVSPYNVFSQSTALSRGSGHGTHVAGLAVGFSLKYSNGYSGVAPNCKLMPIQVFDNNKCTFSALASGIVYAIHHGADVINVSVGPNFKGMDELPVSDQENIARNLFKNEEKVWRKIFSIAKKHNAIIVFAGGNDNILACVPPNNRTNQTINVAAIDKSKSKTSFTNYNEGTNISAPGQGIFSSVPKNKYEAYDGTSMAAPIVSGVVALMRSIKPDLTVSEAICVLQTTGECVSNNIPPMVRADRAVTAVRDGQVSSDCDGVFVPGKPKEKDVKAGDNQDDDPYKQVRDMIEFYKKKIEELEKQLPKN